ncbi:glycoside hydrolase 68 family protein [Arthrobacter sp. TPD3018]|uniref:glycoside hydrolase family 68 protein n=1 Tax=Bacteria TaxID=2 RepID=UPI000D51C2F9|nr:MULTISPECIES: glycoside hydrolase family 68 protein [Bacteria]PVE57820.1 glycoside hydrolase 68 family protein [Sphingomonas sp. TPD3009]PVE58689.1 glycoside hydrolase 68 family protein [Arthrobacter sp. TPD3018]PVE86098.1 glycoside hydrolase 68 family protein [Sphingomonas melonis]
MSVWRREDAARAVADAAARLPVILAKDVVAIDPTRDLWDMWPIARRDGTTATIAGRQYWFFLAVPHAPDPEARHDVARIRLYSIGADGWRDHGDAFPDGFTPGTREWSGSAWLHEDGETLTMHFTAAGVAGGGPRFMQRLFETTGRLVDGRVTDWGEPIETVRADGHWYAPTEQDAPVDDRIKGFRDPGYFQDPVTAREHLLFTGSAAGEADVHDGVIGLATRDGLGWAVEAPLVSAIGVNNELERPHIVVRDGLYYLFWSTQAKRFAAGIGAPTGLYGMVADELRGPWRPLNGSGLVAANPVEEPSQAYCWWVTGEGDVLSFVDYWGLKDVARGTDAAFRRAHFGGTAAPFFRLNLKGDTARIA